MRSPQLDHIVFPVPQEAAGLRLDKAMSLCSAIVSRSQASRLISLGHVMLSGEKLKASYIVSSTDIIDIFIPTARSESLTPYNYPLEFIFEDSDLIVVNKPAGLVVHPAHGHFDDTLINALVFHRKDLSMGFAENRPGLVHRLDRDTSGVLVIAKNELAQHGLAKQFERKTAHRRYRAVVLGRIAEPHERRIESLLARHPSERKKFASLDAPSESIKSKKAVTHVQVLSQNDSFSLIELKLETGRTHQIRVHLSELGYPVAGDEIYGGKARISHLKSAIVRKFILNLPRFALHAYELGFAHPRTGENLFFSAPWPHDLEELLTLSKLSWPVESKTQLTTKGKQP